MQKKKIKTLTALQVNAGIRAAYRKELEKQLQDMHNSVIYWLLATYKQEEPKIAQDGVFESITERFNWLKKRWMSAWNKFASLSAKRFVTKTKKDAEIRINNSFKKAGVSLAVKNTHALSAVSKSLIAENVKLIKTIPQQYLDDVYGIVMRGIQQGNNVRQINKEIKSRYQISERRAKTIAIDQSNKAIQAIQRTNDLDLGITKGKWRHHGGQKTSRLTHARFDGQEFDLTGPDKGLYDSDVGHRVLPGELWNCRCTYLRVIPEEFS